MADVWDGGTTTVGNIKSEFNTDRSAMRFSRVDLGLWPPNMPLVLTNDLVALVKATVEKMELLAVTLDSIDATFSATVRTRLGQYKNLAGLT